MACCINALSDSLPCRVAWCVTAQHDGCLERGLRTMEDEDGGI